MKRPGVVLLLLGVLAVAGQAESFTYEWRTANGDAAIPVSLKGIAHRSVVICNVAHQAGSVVITKDTSYALRDDSLATLNRWRMVQAADGSISEVAFEFLGKDENLHRTDPGLSDTFDVYDGTLFHWADSSFVLDTKVIDQKNITRKSTRAAVRPIEPADVLNNFEEGILYGPGFQDLLSLVRSGKTAEAMNRTIRIAMRMDSAFQYWTGSVTAVEEEVVPTPKGSFDTYKLTFRFQVPFLLGILRSLGGTKPEMPLWVAKERNILVKYVRQNDVFLLTDYTEP